MDPTAKEILEMVHSFYSTAWGQLITYTTILVALIGVVIPLISQWFQRKSSNLDKRELETYLKLETNQIRDDLVEQIKNEIETIKEEFRDELEKIRIEASKNDMRNRGGTLHVQGGINLKEKKFSSALESYVEAGTCYIVGEDEFNLRRVLTMIEKACLPQINKEELKILSVPEDRLAVFLTQLEEINERSRYSDAIKSITLARSAAEQREKSSPSSSVTI